MALTKQLHSCYCFVIVVVVHAHLVCYLAFFLTSWWWLKPRHKRSVHFQAHKASGASHLIMTVSVLLTISHHHYHRLLHLLLHSDAYHFKLMGTLYTSLPEIATSFVILRLEGCDILLLCYVCVRMIELNIHEPSMIFVCLSCEGVPH